MPIIHHQKKRGITNRKYIKSICKNDCPFFVAQSSHFGSDQNNRLGFKKLFREASDERFDEAVEMIKYVVKRGGNVKQALSIEVSCRANREIRY